MNRFRFKSLLIGLSLTGTHCFSAPEYELAGWVALIELVVLGNAMVTADDQRSVGITQAILVPWALWASNVNKPEEPLRSESVRRNERKGLWSGLAVWETMALYNIVRPSFGRAEDFEVIPANFVLANCALAATLYFFLREEPGEKKVSLDILPTRYGMGAKFSLKL